MSTGLTPVAKRQHELKKSLRSLLERGKEEFAAVLPKHMDPERMIRVAITACTIQPKLLDCTKESVALALLTASQTGLEPDGYHGHLIPYGNRCQFIPDWKGLVQLALEHGVVVDGYAVYEQDHFKYQLGTDPKIEHVPSDADDPGPLKCAYAVATFPNGHVKFVVATRSAVMRRKAVSKGAHSKDSPWVQWEPEMWVKSAVKMLSKYIPRSHKLTAALRADDMAEMGVQQNPVFDVQVPKPSVTESIVDRLESPLPGPDDTPTPEPSPKAKRGKAKQEEPEGGPEDTLSAFDEAIDAVGTEDEVRQLFRTMIHANKAQLPEQLYADAMEHTQWRIDELKEQAEVQS